MKQVCPQCQFDPSRLPFTALSETQDARIQALLGNNDAPFGEERAELRVLLDTNAERVDALTARIEHMRQMLRSLEAEQAAAVAILRDNQAVLHPLRAFSVDVLGLIFQTAQDAVPPISLRDFHRGQFVDSLDISCLPWTLSHVSSRWRRAALSSPRIWTTLVYSFDRHPDSNHVARLLSLYLARSSILGISVHLYSSHVSSNNPGADHRALPMLVVSAPRWTYARLKLSYHSLLFFQSLMPTFDILHTLSLDCSRRMDEQLAHLTLFNTANASRLRNLEAYYGIYRTLRFMQLGRLEDLVSHRGFHDLCHIGSNTVRRVLEYPFLQSITFELENHATHRPPAALGQAFLPPSVKSLKICGRPENAEYYEYPQRVLDFSNLKTLDLCVPFEAVIAPCATPITQLTRLSLEAVDLSCISTMSRLRTLLRDAPRLTRLDIRYTDSTDAPWSFLGLRSGESMPAPDLESLGLLGPRGIVLTHGFVELIRSRQPKLSRIEADWVTDNFRSQEANDLRLELDTLGFDINLER